MPQSELPREVYLLKEKLLKIEMFVSFEMVGSFDLFGIAAPKKLVTRADFAGVGTFVNA